MKLGDLMFIIPAFENINLVCIDSNGNILFDYYRDWIDINYMNCEIISIRSCDFCLQIEIKSGDN